MRGLLLAALAAPLLLFGGSALAQQRAQSVARALPPTLEEVARQPIVRMRPRTVQEKRRLISALIPANVTFMSGGLGGSFMLTPRHPLVAGRGALSTERTSFAPTFDTTGFHVGYGFQSGLTFHVVNLNNNRLLVDCAVSSAEGIPFEMWVSDLNASGVGRQQSIAQDGRIAFVTHVIAHSAYLNIGPVAHAMGATDDWIFTGCEFTVLAAN